MEDADPLMAGAQIGKSFTSPTGTFSEVPDDLRQKVEVKLNAELYFPGFSGIIGALGALNGASGIPGTSATTVLDQTFNTVDLVGRPLSIGNYVSSAPVETIFAPVINTYSPYIEIGGEANFDPSQDQIIRGTDYQEILSGFPLANQVLTGLFLNVTVSGPNGSPQSYEKTLFDRIGYAARQGLAAPSNLSVDPSGAPALSPSDIVSLALAPSDQPASALAGELAGLNALRDEMKAAVAPTTGSKSSADLETLARRFGTLVTANLAGVFLASSDREAPSYDTTFLTRSYFDSPRIVAVSDKFTVDPATQNTTLATELDILKDIPRVYASPVQSTDVVQAATALRGFVDSQIESTIASQFASQPDAQASSAYGTFFAALNSGETLATIDKDHIGTISQLSISADAKARITNAVADGRVVLVPNGEVTIDGKATIAWIEFDASTGFMIFVSEDGAHNVVEDLYAKLIPLTAAGIALEQATVNEGAAFLENGTLEEASTAILQETSALAPNAIQNTINSVFNANVASLRALIANESNFFLKNGLQ